MNKLHNQLLLFVALGIILISTASCSIFRKTSRARVNTLLITGNYMQPRLLAELSQYRSKQPIILCQNDGGETRLFYLDGNQKSEEISTAKFKEFVGFLNPKTVIFMGGEAYVPSDLVNQVRSDFRIMLLLSDSWDQNAQMLGEIMNQPKLNRLFKEYLEKYDQANEIQASK